MSRLILHVGMPQTGSSSIQETLFSWGGFKEFHYADLGMANHGEVITSLFEQDRFAKRGHRLLGRSSQEIEHFNQQALSRLEKVCEAKGQPIISGEDIWHLSEQGLEKVRDFFINHFDHIEVISYVKPPSSFMVTSFQEGVKKNSLARLRLESHYPHYQEKFEKFDRVFGQQNVTLRLFDPKQLVGRDVVIDFCHLLGESISPEHIQHVNESLSLEATAVLFTYRREGIQYAHYKGKALDNNTLVDSLTDFGALEMRFADALIAPVVQRHRSDIDWIEARLGQPMNDQSNEDANIIASEAQLLEVASRQFDALETYVNKQVNQVEPTPEQLAHWIEKLRTAIAGRSSNGVAPLYGSQGFFTDEQMSLLEDDKLSPVIALREMALSFERHGHIDEARSVIETALILRPDAKGLLALLQRINAMQNVKINKSLGGVRLTKDNGRKKPPSQSLKRLSPHDPFPHTEDTYKLCGIFFERFQTFLLNNELNGLDQQKVNLENFYNEFFRHVEIHDFLDENSDFDGDLIELCEFLSSHQFTQDSLISAIKTGSVSINLSGGKAFSCRHSIRRGPFNYLRFTGGEVFFIFQDNFSAEAIYFPERKKIIRLKQCRNFERKVKSFIEELIEDLLRYSLYFANPKSCFDGIFLAHKSPFHYYVFKFAPLLGVAKKFDSELFSVYSSMHKNFLSWQDILPNTISKEVILDSPNDLKDLALNNGFFYFQPGDRILKQSKDSVEAADDYLHTRVLALCSSYSVVREAMELRSHCDFFVWLGVTTGKREWVEEESGLIALIGCLAERFKRVAIVFDGWTSTLNKEVGGDLKNQNLYTEDASRVARILERIPHNVSTLSLVGETVYSKIAVGNLVDFFVSNHATGSLWISRICQKPGVTHLSNVALRTSRRMHVHPHAVEFPPNLVTDLPSSENSSAFHVSYSIKPKQFVNFTMELVDKLSS
tara:strand:+ start:5426 stop:8266 length:2841 start_codon:yes stop_codon:yes gene_type:complete